MQTQKHGLTQRQEGFGRVSVASDVQAEPDIFAVMLAGAGTVYGKVVDEVVQSVYRNVLSEYSVDHVRTAIKAHMLDTEKGQYWPKPADIVRQIERLGLKEPKQAYENHSPKLTISMRAIEMSAEATVYTRELKKLKNSLLASEAVKREDVDLEIDRLVNYYTRSGYEITNLIKRQTPSKARQFFSCEGAA